MLTRMPARLVRACLFAFALGTAGPILAVPLMDMRAEDLVPMAAEFKKSMNLNANQQTLWQQVESRSRALLNEQLMRVVPEGVPAVSAVAKRAANAADAGWAVTAAAAWAAEASISADRLLTGSQQYK